MCQSQGNFDWIVRGRALSLFGFQDSVAVNMSKKNGERPKKIIRLFPLCVVVCMLLFAIRLRLSVSVTVTTTVTVTVSVSVTDSLSLLLPGLSVTLCLSVSCLSLSLCLSPPSNICRSVSLSLYATPCVYTISAITYHFPSKFACRCTVAYYCQQIIIDNYLFFMNKIATPPTIL